ncbi:hypothetical protein CDD80_1378 [Ophiocordyceps camponoti-rufipedis]|uniref:Uncharacterized protein n=1 Tax=Ophiocordyceps camponoti-rufipedis TaxID=2004952 RepID=A0A2C5Z9S4_9HYPO|nr:hypothetical protein CDD80_1378 [Ophiocordyceps camponoti-rufipedis]
MKFQAVVLVMAGAVSCVDMQPFEAMRRLLVLDRMIDNYKEVPGGMDRETATCNLLCCRKKSFEGICSSCRDICGGGVRNDDEKNDKDDKSKKNHDKGVEKELFGDNFDRGFNVGGGDKDENGGSGGKGVGRGSSEGNGGPGVPVYWGRRGGSVRGGGGLQGHPGLGKDHRVGGEAAVRAASQST